MTLSGASTGSPCGLVLVWFGFGLAWFWFDLVEWRHRGDTTIDDPIGLDWIGRGVTVGM